MTSISDLNTETTDIRDHLNRETAKIPWKDLQRFFASGSTLFVTSELDLIDVAEAFQRDQAIQVEAWLQQELIAPVQVQQAKKWVSSDSVMWAVVIKPWVLVQLVEVGIQDKPR